MKPSSSILVLAQYYRPEPNFITADVAAALARRGAVTVITTHPNYPLGRFYPGVRGWLPSVREEGGVRVWRIPCFPYHGPSKLGRFFCYLTFTLGAVLLAPLVAPRARLVWVYNTPFSVALAALWFRYARGARLVYTCADLWPESIVGAGAVRAGRLSRALGRYRRAVNRAAHLIVCATRGIEEAFAAEGVSRARLRHIPLWVDGSDAGEPLLDRASAGGEPVLVYAGNLGPAQGLEAVVKAAGLLRERGTHVRFDLYGTGSAEGELRALASQLGADNVCFRGRVAPAAAFRACTHAAGQIVTLRPTPHLHATVPSKLVFSFAAAAPLLYGLEGEAGEVARESGGGIPFCAGDGESLAAAVAALLALPPAERVRMRRLLRERYESGFARETLTARYVSAVCGSGSAVAVTGEGIRREPVGAVEGA